MNMDKLLDKADAMFLINLARRCGKDFDGDIIKYDSTYGYYVNASAGIVIELGAKEN